jgi:hypothetical protein
VPAGYEVRTTSTYGGVRAIEILMRDPFYLPACSPLRCETHLWDLHCRRKINMMRVSELPRPSPERLLLQAQAEENKRWGARLKIFRLCARIRKSAQLAWVSETTGVGGLKDGCNPSAGRRRDQIGGAGDRFSNFPGQLRTSPLGPTRALRAILLVLHIVIH